MEDQLKQTVADPNYNHSLHAAPFQSVLCEESETVWYKSPLLQWGFGGVLCGLFFLQLYWQREDRIASMNHAHNVVKDLRQEMRDEGDANRKILRDLRDEQRVANELLRRQLGVGTKVLPGE